MNKYWLVMILLFINSTSLLAQDAVPKAKVWIDTVPHYRDQMLLASSQNNFQTDSDRLALTEPEPIFKERFFTWNKTHQYLGIGSLALASIAAMVQKEGSGSIHHELAVSATVLGVGAVTTGFVFHLNDIDLSKGLKDPDNVHMGLGALGTLGYLVAVSSAPESVHSTAGIIGVVGMLVAIKYTW